MIQKESYGFNTFIGTRISEIHSHSNPSDSFKCLLAAISSSPRLRCKVSIISIIEINWLKVSNFAENFPTRCLVGIIAEEWLKHFYF